MESEIGRRETQGQQSWLNVGKPRTKQKEGLDETKKEKRELHQQLQLLLPLHHLPKGQAMPKLLNLKRPKKMTQPKVVPEEVGLEKELTKNRHQPARPAKRMPKKEETALPQPVEAKMASPVCFNASENDPDHDHVVEKKRRDSLTRHGKTCW